MSKLDRLSLVGGISWEAVFETWRENEGGREEWEKFAKEVKGWSGWEEWRRFSSSIAGLERLEWKMYEVISPMSSIPEFLVGPFTGWQNQVSQDEKNEISFMTFVEKCESWIKNHEKISGIMNRFPEETKLIGLYCADRDEIVCFEGSHRCAAVALAKYTGRDIVFKKNPMIAIATITGNSHEMMDKILDTSSSRPGFQT